MIGMILPQSKASKAADGMTNSVDPDQTAPLGLHCLPRPVCMNT